MVKGTFHSAESQEQVRAEKLSMHFEDQFSNVQDRNSILRSKGKLKGMKRSIGRDHTPLQQEERRKEWEKIKEARQSGNWTILWNRRAKIDEFKGTTRK
jgi:hypothetical protein